VPAREDHRERRAGRFQPCILHIIALYPLNLPLHVLPTYSPVSVYIHGGDVWRWCVVAETPFAQSGRVTCCRRVALKVHNGLRYSILVYASALHPKPCPACSGLLSTAFSVACPGAPPWPQFTGALPPYLLRVEPSWKTDQVRPGARETMQTGSESCAVWERQSQGVVAYNAYNLQSSRRRVQERSFFAYPRPDIHRGNCHDLLSARLGSDSESC
jgi:hypothetical protein